MGGDEFAAILFVEREQFEWIRRQFEGDIKYWSCNRIKELSISYGYVSSSEGQWDSMKEISDVADIRMYEEKAMYYKKKWSRPSGTASLLCSSLQIVYTDSPNQSGKRPL